MWHWTCDALPLVRCVQWIYSLDKRITTADARCGRCAVWSMRGNWKRAWRSRLQSKKNFLGLCAVRRRSFLNTHASARREHNLPISVSPPRSLAVTIRFRSIKNISIKIGFFRRSVCVYCYILPFRWFIRLLVPRSVWSDQRRAVVWWDFSRVIKPLFCAQFMQMSLNQANALSHRQR